MKQDYLSKFWLFVVPALLIIAQIAIETFVPGNMLAAVHSEQGPHEALQVLIIGSAFVVALITLVQMDKTKKCLMAWVGLAALCCFYVVGEEISWGQHVMGWNTPEYWATLNDQGETNLHNISSWLDQKPRLILLLGVIIGGLIIPALARFKPGSLPEKFEIIYPPASLSVVAFCALAVNLTDKADDFIGNLMERSSEVEEVFLFYFVLLYLVILRRRIMQQQG